MNWEWSRDPTRPVSPLRWTDGGSSGFTSVPNWLQEDKGHIKDGIGVGRGCWVVRYSGSVGGSWTGTTCEENDGTKALGFRTLKMEIFRESRLVRKSGGSGSGRREVGVSVGRCDPGQ